MARRIRHSFGNGVFPPGYVRSQVQSYPLFTIAHGLSSACIDRSRRLLGWCHVEDRVV
jgi:hypothetical protein